MKSNRSPLKAFRFTPHLEFLESRRVFNAVQWILPTSGSWETAANWLDTTTQVHRVPNSGDDVTINLPGNLTVDISSNESVKSLNCANTLAINSGQLNIEATSKITGSLIINGGALGPFGTLELAGTTIWNGGEIFRQGTVNTGTFTFSGAAANIISGTLVNRGTIRSQGVTAMTVVGNGGLLDNQSAGIIDFQSDAEITGTAVIKNAGTIRKTGGSGISRVGPSPNSDIYFNQLGGTLDAQIGTLKIDQVRTNLTGTGGVWNAKTGAVLDIVGNGPFGTTIGGTFTGNGGGKVLLEGGGIGADATNGLTFNFPAGLLHWVSAGLYATGGQSIINNGLITHSGSNEVSLSNRFVNNGSLVQSGTGRITFSGSTFENTSTGVVDFQSDGEMAGGGIFNNAGTIRKSAGSGVARIGLLPNADLYFNQIGGTLDAQTGTLQIDQVRTNLTGTGGVWNAKTGAVLDLVGNGPSGTIIGGTFTGTGGGKVLLDGGNFGADGTNGLTFNFPVGLLHWVAGGLYTQSGQTIVNNGSITLSGSSDVILYNQFVNHGTVYQTGSGNLSLTNNGAGIFNNRPEGRYEIQSSGGVNGTSGAFNNFGLLIKSTSLGLTTLGNSNFAINNDSGTIQVDSGHLTIASPGLWSNAKLNSAANTVLEVSGWPSLAGITTGIGAGQVQFSGGWLPSDGGVQGQTSTLQFSGDLLHWTGGEIGSGIPAVNAGTITIDGPNLKSMRRNTLINTGTIIHSGPGDIQLYGIGDFVGSTIDNRPGATFELRGDTTITQNHGNLGTFINGGLLIKSAGGSVSQLEEDLVNSPSGVIDVRTGTLQLMGGSHSTGGTFLVSQGAVLEFSQVSAVFYMQGHYTGEGAGTIHFKGLLAGIDDTMPAYLNFPSGFFEMNAGQWLGSIVNEGFITVNGGPFARTHFINMGTMTIVGTGDLEFNANTFFENQGLLDIKSDVNIDVPADASGGDMRFLNTGTIRKSGGTGTSQLRHSGNNKAFRLNNTGILEVLTGTLVVSDTPTQLTGTTLTSGMWIVRDGATLGFPASATISKNQGSIFLDGANTSFSALAALTSNSGVISLTRGKNLTTTGNLQNSGTLTIGPGSTVTVPGNFTQITPGLLEISIAGRPDSNQYGRLIAAGSAVLGGALDLQIENGFGPVQGDQYPIVGYAGKQNQFGAIGGLTPFFSANVGSNQVTITAGASAANLAVQSITAPGTAIVGQIVSIPFTIRNTSSTPIVGDWTDSVYLSPTSTLGTDAVLVARVPHQGGLAGLADYTATAQATLPNVVDGVYRIIVVSDSSQLIPDRDRSDNSLSSTSAVAISVPALPLNMPTAATIAKDEERLYRIDVPATAGDLVVSTSFSVVQQANVFLSRGILPRADNAISQQTASNNLQAQLIAANPTAGAYYLLIRGREGAALSSNFSITPKLSAFEARAVAPNQGSNLGTVTVTVSGSGFTSNSVVKLTSGGFARNAQSVTFKDSTTLFATFDLTGLSSGTYDLTVVDQNRSSTVNSSFTVIAGRAGKLQYTLSVPATIRAGAISEAYIDYSNVGDTDLPAPVLVVTGVNANLKLSTQSSFGDGRVEFLAIGNSGPAGVLAPGAHGRVVVQVQQQTTGAHVTSKISVSTVDSSSPLDWTQLKNPLKPPTMQQDAWDAIWSNLVADFGTTYTQYQLMMDQTASALSQVGIYTADIARLLAYRIRIADNFGAITGRYALGAFGRGQSDTLNIRATTDSTGVVSISSAGTVRPFLPLQNAKYVGLPGDNGVLVKLPDNGYRLTETDGTVSVFSSDGRISYRQDRNGNRLSWSYNGANVTALTQSNGDVTQFIYNAQGRVVQMIDAVGRGTTYTYTNNGTGDQLIQISDATGTTKISYVTGQGAARENAISQIEFPDGTKSLYEYDSRGRMTKQTQAGGVAPVTYTYDAVSGVTITDALNRVTKVFRDDSGNPAQLIDPIGNAIRKSVDANGALSQVVNLNGATTTANRNAQGSPTQIIGSMGPQLNLTYAANGTQLLTAAGPNGASFTFAYDANGNVISESSASGQPILLQYDSRGNVVQRTTPNGRSETDTFNSAGLLTHRSFSDGSTMDYTYDAHRNLTSVSDASGMIRMQYDSADRLTGVSYPDGRTIQYKYDIFGRQIQVKTGDQYILNKSYDAAGRLQMITDAANHLLVRMEYDAANQLQKQTFGNGTSTEYEYTSLGQIFRITNRAADQSISSQIEYEYDALGRTTAMTSNGAKTTYGYDAGGELTSVLLPGGRMIRYTYDAAGNRIRVTDSAGNQAIDYTSNHNNELTSTGNATFTYDAYGNLATRTDNTDTTTYSYDVQNRLIGVVNSSNTFAYEYDALGHRSAVIHNGVRTEYLTSPNSTGDVLGEYDGSGNLIAHYAQGFGLIGRTDASGTNAFYQFDSLGNVTGLTGSNGTIQNQYSYLPFGEKLSATGTTPNPFTFVGRAGVMDSGDGLYFMRNRLYDPKTGRFTQGDPIGLNGGDANFYRYVHNNPVSFIDPSGNFGVIPLNPSAFLPFGNFGNEIAASQAAINSFLNAAIQSEAPAAGTAVTGLGTEGLAVAGTGIAGVAAPLVAAGALSAAPLIAANREAFNAEFNPEIQPVLNFSEDDYVRNVRKAKNNHPLLEAVARRIANNNNHPEPTAQDYIDANNAIRTAEKNGTIEARTPQDPNAISGPSGVGSAGFVLPDQLFGYHIEFENTPNASAPAQVVTVRQQLDADLDWSTFQLGDFGFAGQTFVVPEGLTTYHTRIDDRAKTGVDVDVLAEFNTTTGLLTWTFSSLLPATGDIPSDVLTGFLLPNVSSPQGEAFVAYTIQPKAGSITGTAIPAQATVFFNAGLSDQSSLDTNTYLNTIDDSAPTSTANPLPAQSTSLAIPVSWAGNDVAGSGIATYSIFVSENGGSFIPWLTNTTQTSGTYTGVNGSTYGFVAVATDLLGITQPMPSTAQATTTIALQTPTGQPISREFSVGSNSSINFYNPDGTLRSTLTPFPNFTGGIRTASADFNGDGIADLVVGTGPGSATHVKVFDGVSQAEIFSIDPFEASFTGGVFVAAGDINGDGKAELAISPDEGGGPRVRVFNGNGFAQIADFFGIDDPNFRGGARSAIGDMNGDGKGDLIVAAGFGGGPRVAAFDGSQLTGNGGPKLFGDFFVFETGLRNGIFVAAGDVNGDGFADLVAGGGPGGGPRVYILDGKSLVQTGSDSLVPIGNFFAGDTNNRGGVRVAVKNLDNDSKADVVTGSGSGAGSRVTAYLGSNISASSGTPPTALDFDAFAGFTGGVFVG